MDKLTIILPSDATLSHSSAAIRQITDIYESEVIHVGDLTRLELQNSCLDIVFLPSNPDRWRDWGNGLRGKFPSRKFLAVIDTANTKDAQQILETAFREFILLPPEPSVLLERIRGMLLPYRRTSVRLLREKLLQKIGMSQLLGESDIFVRSIERIPNISQSDAATLITGESGTGKEVCARAIHYLSSRADRPFIPVNCASIPDNLFENELFGHVKGAYTDAGDNQFGLIAEANGGTLFLDEINSLSLYAQVKLLRFLEDRKYKPLGSSKYLDADIRFVCATNADLASEVGAGRFREDLYYRIKVLTIDLPALRLRDGDIKLLSEHFLGMYSETNNRGVMCFSSSAMKKLNSHDWPGNIRELKNIIERAAVMSFGNIIQPEEIDIPVVDEAEKPLFRSFSEAKEQVVMNFEKQYLLRVLQASDWNITKAAEQACKDRRSFQKLIKKHGIVSAAIA